MLRYRSASYGILVCSRVIAMVVLFGLLLSDICIGQTLLGCPAWPGQAEGVRYINGAAIRISSETESPIGSRHFGCLARITDNAGRTLFLQRGRVLTMEQISGSDINGDGPSDIVIRGERDSGYIYYFIGLKTNPPLFKTLENGYGIWFERSDRGRVILVVPDDGFQGLPDLLDIHHYESVVPKIRFVLSGSCLQDMSGEYRRSYDSEIKKTQSTPSPMTT